MTAEPTYDVTATLGMSKPEFLRLVEHGVPDEARFDDFTGDADLTLTWRTRHTPANEVDRLAAAEAAAWKAWQVADEYENTVADLHQKAADDAGELLTAWRHAAAALADADPARLVYQASQPRDLPADADHQDAEPSTAP